jgi:hypothetical protein
MSGHEPLTWAWPQDDQFMPTSGTVHEQPKSQPQVDVPDERTDAPVLQSDELEALESILGDDFILSGSKANDDDSTSFFIVARSHQLSVVAPEYFLTIEIRLPDLYPYCLPTVVSIVSNSGVLSNSMEDELYMALLTHANSMLGEPMIYDLFSLTCDFLCNKVITRDVPKLSMSSLDSNTQRAYMLERALCPEVVKQREEEEEKARKAAEMDSARMAQEERFRCNNHNLDDLQVHVGSSYDNSYDERETERLERAQEAQEAVRQAAFDYADKNALNVQHMMLNRPTFRSVSTLYVRWDWGWFDHHTWQTVQLCFTRLSCQPAFLHPLLHCRNCCGCMFM